MRTLVIGYGNLCRGDDGAGVRVAERLAQLRLPGVEVRTAHQLQPEWAEDCALSERLVFIDAATTGEPVALRPLGDSSRESSQGGHDLSPEALVALARQLYGRTPEAHLCTIRGIGFGFADTLSPEVIGRVEEAVVRVTALLSIPPPESASLAGRV